MKLTVDEFIHFTSFIRRADDNGMTSNIQMHWGSETGGSSDPLGEDPYFDQISLSFEDDEGEEHEIVFENTTPHTVWESLWSISDAIPIT
jgi:hypothetical protein